MPTHGKVLYFKPVSLKWKKRTRNTLNRGQLQLLRAEGLIDAEQHYLWSSVLGEPALELTPGGAYRAYVYSPGGGLLGLQSPDGYFYWVHGDDLGSGRRLTDGSGAVVYQAEFDPHGQMVKENPANNYLNSHKFTGYERDWAIVISSALKIADR